MKGKSEYPLCRYLQRVSRLPLRELAKRAGFTSQSLWRACRKGRVSEPLIVGLLKVLPKKAVKSYVRKALLMKAKEEIRKWENFIDKTEEEVKR